MRRSEEIDWQAVREFYEEGHSMRECKSRFGFSNYAWDCSRSAWHEAIRTGRLTARSSLIPIEELLSEGRPCSRGHLKGRLLKAGLKEERCETCGLAGWRGRPLRIALHHVNGDGYDNRLENLLFLCPNCHSQTSNFAGRNRHLRARPEV